MTKTKPFFHLTVAVASVLGALGQQATAQQATDQLFEPIFRVAHEEPAGQTPQLASRIAQPSPPAVPFDLRQRPGEHPLMPAMRLAKDSLATIDTSIRDYSAVLIKQERIDGTLGEEQAAFIKVRHQPFAVYMFFLKPYKGRECLYNAGPGGEKGVLVAMDCGWKRRFGKLEFDPEGHMAMKGQKYPIMKLGVRKLAEELVQVATNDVQFSECDVKTSQRTMNGRPVTLLEVTHPVPRKNFRFYKAQVFIDNELRIPIRYAAYLWPENPGEAPPLEEAYTYLNIKVNNDYTDLDFDKENPAIFKTK